MADNTAFHYRSNNDGSFDSICTRCFYTVKRTSSALEARHGDPGHVCDDLVWVVNPDGPEQPAILLRSA